MKKVSLILIIILSQITFSYAQCWVAVSSGAQHVLAIKNDGTLWAWGSNLKGALGNGGSTNSNIPIQVGTDNDWASISASQGYFSTGIKTNGTLWTWGYNVFGQLGDGTNTDKLIPTQVGASTDWASVSAGGLHTLAIKNNGTLWAWGENGGGGALGDGGAVTTTNVPIQIGTSTDWKNVYAGYQYSMGIKNDSTLWVWGANPFGQLGDGTNMTKTVPTLIGTSSNKWLDVAIRNKHSMALRTNGTLWATGENNFGQLGDGTTTSRTSFGQVGTTTWKKIAVGAHHSLGIKTNGTLWAWGYNTSGQLGDGTQVDKYTPSMTDTITNWEFIGAGSNYSIANKTDNILWTWGSNAYGELGNGTIVNSSSNAVGVTVSDCDPFPTSSTTISKYTPIPFYPNPAYGVVHFPASKNVQLIQLINIEGQVIKKVTVHGTAIMDVSSLANGVYFIKFKGKENSQMQKLVISH